MALADDLAEIKAAVAELALTHADFAALDPRSPFHGSSHVRGKLIRTAPTLTKIVDEYIVEESERVA